MVFRRYLREDDSHYFLNEDGTISYHRVEDAIGRFTLSGDTLSNIIRISGKDVYYLCEGTTTQVNFSMNTNICNLNPYNLREALSTLLLRGENSSSRLSYIKISDWIIICEAMLRKEDL